MQYTCKGNGSYGVIGKYVQGSHVAIQVNSTLVKLIKQPHKMNKHKAIQAPLSGDFSIKSSCYITDFAHKVDNCQ